MPISRHVDAAATRLNPPRTGTRHGYRNGWLDPEGNFHPLGASHLHCEWCVHKGMKDCQAIDMGETGCRLDLDGWFKLTDGKWIILMYPHKTTKRQCDYIFDWHVLNEQPLDAFMTLLKEFM
jgi:hypothetical protein